MKTIIHKADTRGATDFGWLKARYSFSFANYYNPDNVHFGMLRVLNDDIVQPGRGFDMHPHADMEIVSIPLRGALRHKDNTGNEAVIRAGDVQIMSAGTGITHSEYNASDTEEVNLLQLWIFPEKKGGTPRYEQKSFDRTERINHFQTVVSPENEPGLTIRQQAFLSLGYIEKGKEIDYQLNRRGNGVYTFMIEGKSDIAGEVLAQRDAAEIRETDQFTVKVEENSEILLIEVPMN